MVLSVLSVCTDATPNGAVVEEAVMILPPLSICRLIRLLLPASFVAIIRHGVVLFTIDTFSGMVPGTIQEESALEIVSVNGVPTSPRTLKVVAGGTDGVLPTNPPNPLKLLLQLVAIATSAAPNTPHHSARPIILVLRIIISSKRRYDSRAAKPRTGRVVGRVEACGRTRRTRRHRRRQRRDAGRRAGYRNPLLQPLERIAVRRHAERIRVSDRRRRRCRSHRRLHQLYVVLRQLDGRAAVGVGGGA